MLKVGGEGVVWLLVKSIDEIHDEMVENISQCRVSVWVV